MRGFWLGVLVGPWVWALGVLALVGALAYVKAIRDLWRRRQLYADLRRVRLAPHPPDCGCPSCWDRAQAEALLASCGMTRCRDSER